jgi:putative endonuclease
MITWLLGISDALRDRARCQVWNSGLASGRRAEDLAHRWLQRRGLTIVARNWRPHSGSGEIDIVAREGETLVIVEVKSRAADEHGAPERNVDDVKRRTLVRAGLAFARRAGIPLERVRFDLVTVLLVRPPVIAHQRDAFSAHGL